MSKNPVIRRALVSVSDKTGLIPFVEGLLQSKVEIISTGGTLKVLKEAGIPAKAVDEVTGFPEILEGRVKTLHPKIHGGLLFRRDKKSHESEAAKHGIEPIDLVVVNLYPFEAVTAKDDVSLEVAIENIDIGGPSMLRSAAKNFDAVTVVCDPADYQKVLEEMKMNKGAVPHELRRRLAEKVFERTSTYDRTIANFLTRQHEVKTDSAAGEAPALPEHFEIVCKKAQTLRYGENPHQHAALYTIHGGQARFRFEQFHGKELSFNNLVDIEAAVDVVREFDGPAACVIKHNNPSGIAENKNLPTALRQAIECDMMSAFGGILATNRPCDKETAQAALEQLGFFEVFVAPSFDAVALKLLKERKNLRLIAAGPFDELYPYDVRFMKVGALIQAPDHPVRFHLADLKKNLRFVTKIKLTDSEIDQLLFAWKCVKVVKSNAIVITQGFQTVGIGAGQMSRVDSVYIACRKAGYRTEGGILASDAFFPMPDSIEEAAEHKIRVIIQPGGSIRDQDVINACDRLGIAMALTGERHFKH